MIEKLEVEGLNVKVNADLKFNADLNIVTGANGSGKTTVLKLMWYLISGQIERALDITFQYVSIETDQFQLSISLENLSESEFQIEWSFSDQRYGEGSLETLLENAEWDCDSLNRNIAETMRNSLFFPSFRRIEGGFSRIPQALGPARRTRSSGRAQTRESNPLQDAVSQLSNERSVGNHKFVTSFSTTDIVELLPQKHIEISEEINAIYADLSRDLEGEIPSNSALERQEANSVLEQIREGLNEANSKEKELRNPLTSLNDSIDEIFSRRITIAEGFMLGEKENDAISSDKLSYGEQQMLSFLCYNAFSSDTTIFIDEPELSLHVDWQRLLLPTLLDQRTGNQFFIATHSPFIYANYPDEEFLLGYDRGGEI